MPETVSSPAPPSKAKVFARRLLSSVLLWGVVLAGLFAFGPRVSAVAFVTAMVILAAAGLLEFYGMIRGCKLPAYPGLGLIAGVALVLAVAAQHSGVMADCPITGGGDLEAAVLALTLVALCARQVFSRDNSQALTVMATTLLGLMYVPWLLNFLLKINFFPFAPDTPAQSGTFYVLYFIAVTKFSDIGAYCTGSLIGRHKMIPRISPGKTWEGFGGAIAVSTGVSVAFAHFAGAQLPGMTLGHAVVLGVLLSAAAVVGDLVESTFKRQAGMKDSGAFFPGIGGILDLLDSLLFNAPLMYLYLRFVIGSSFPNHG